MTESANGAAVGHPDADDDACVVVEPPENKVAWRVFGCWLIVLIATMIGGYFVSPQVPNSSFVSAAAVLTFVTSAAVGIERVIEGAFALLGQSCGFGGWWPLKQVSGAILAFEKNTNAYISTPLANAITELSKLKTAAVAAGELTEQAQREVEAAIAAYGRTRGELEARLANLRKLAPGSPRFALANELAAEATETMNAISETARRVGGLGDSVLSAADTIAGAANRAADIAASFSDNPARRVLSLMAGSILGIAVASFMGLNVFLAILDAPPDARAEPPAVDAPTGIDAGICDDGGPAACLNGRAGVLVTGMLIGLGSSPTHEVIKALQRRRGYNGDDATDEGAHGTGVDHLGVTASAARELELTTFVVTAPDADQRATAPIRRRKVRSTD
jgi:hypothetical protein